MKLAWHDGHVTGTGLSHIAKLHSGYLVQP
jgi:hypothetical protein